MRKLTQNKVSESTWALPLTALYTIGIWWICGLVQEGWWLQLACMAVFTFLMLQLNKLHVLIHIYSRMVSTTFLALACASCFLFPSLNGAIASIFIVQSYILLFTSYQDKEAVGKVFYAFLTLGIASIVQVDILYFVPFFWVLLATNFNALSFRTWIASLLGLITPYWFTATWMLYQGNLSYIPDHFIQLADFQTPFDYAAVPIGHIAVFALLVVMMLIGTVHFIRKSYAESIRTRMFYSIFCWVDFIAAIILVIQPQHEDLLLRVMIINTAPLIAHFFTLTSTKVTNATFYILVAVTLALTAYNVWNTSSLF